MKRFISKIVVFILPPIVVVLIGILLPTTPYASKSLLMAGKNKNLLLQNTTAPRIIFIGGSNLSFGLNSQMIKDSLRLNPINTAINASIGIKYMIDNTLGYVKDGDLVVLVPEYHHYYRSLNWGSEELLRTILDLKLEEIRKLNVSQIINLMPYLPKYSLTKFKPTQYFNVKVDDVYSVNSFNQFGDVYAHWGMKQREFDPFDTIKDEFNSDVINYFEEFNSAVSSKGGTLLVSFPCVQETSFNNSKDAIQKVKEELLKSRLLVIGSANRYKMHDSLMFDTPYHLLKKGVDYRTSLIIQDINKALAHDKVFKK